jgi:hypothetical protein
VLRLEREREEAVGREERKWWEEEEEEEGEAVEKGELRRRRSPSEL